MVRTLIPLLFAGAVAAASPAFAAVYCITDEAELRAALAEVSSSFDSAANELRLTQGIFFNGFFVFEAQIASPTGDFALSGGWTTLGDTSCDVQEIDARLTVLDAQGVSAGLQIRRNSTSGEMQPLISVSNLTIRNGSAASAPVGLYVTNSFGSIVVDNVILHGHRATASQSLGGVAVTLDSSSRDIQLRNSLLYDNEGVFITDFPLADVLFTSLSLNANRNWYVTNNTILQDPDNASEALRLQSDGNFWLINNVVRGGVSYTSSITGAGAATDPQVRQLFNNLSGPPSLSGAVIVSDLFNGTAAPRLDPVTFAPTDGSPLFDAALGSPPGGLPGLDVYGNPRVFNGLLDIGAVEAQTLLPEPGALVSTLAALCAAGALRRARGGPPGA
jgi:hypothetical protein